MTTLVRSTLASTSPTRSRPIDSCGDIDDLPTDPQHSAQVPWGLKQADPSSQPQSQFSPGVEGNNPAGLSRRGDSRDDSSPGLSPSGGTLPFSNQLSEVVTVLGKNGAAQQCTPTNPFWEPIGDSDICVSSAACATPGGKFCGELSPSRVHGGSPASLDAKSVAFRRVGQNACVAPADALKCLGDAVHAIDRENEITLPDCEITMVPIQSWEQKLDWRSFMSEAVALSKAREMFVAFDVDSDPPMYSIPSSSDGAPPPSGGDVAPFGRSKAGI